MRIKPRKTPILFLSAEEIYFFAYHIEKDYRKIVFFDGPLFFTGIDFCRGLCYNK